MSRRISIRRIAKRTAAFIALCLLWLAIAEPAAPQQSITIDPFAPASPYYDPTLLPTIPKPVIGTTAPVRPKIDNLTMAGGGALVMAFIGMGLWLVERSSRPRRDPKTEPERLP